MHALEDSGWAGANNREMRFWICMRGVTLETVTLMKANRARVGLLICALTLSMVGGERALASEPQAGRGKIRVLLVYGGHDFETNQFFHLFAQMPELTIQREEYPGAQKFFAAEHAKDYDVLVFYDMWQDISQKAKTDLIDRLREGKGLVALHHCLASFQSWEEYARIIGGRYHLKSWVDHGEEKPGSTYLHDVDFTAHVAHPNHPVTAGLQDFKMHDETYGGFEVGPQSDVLLTSDAPTSGRDIAWAKTYGPARVVYIQLGHDHRAYENPNYQRLVRQAIQWTAQAR